MTDAIKSAKQRAGDDKRAGGRTLRRWTGTAAESKQRAATLVASNDFSELKRWIITDLWRFMALTEDQLWRRRNAVFPADVSNESGFQRLLSNYRWSGLIDVLPHVNSLLVEVGIRPTTRISLRPYALGPVGSEAMLHIVGGEKSADHPYRGEGERRLAHDLICSEILLRWSQLAQSGDGSPLKLETRGPREVLARSEDDKQTEVAPDGMVISWRDGVISRRYLVEYHNEDWGGRAEKKIELYEKAAENTAKNRRTWRNLWAGNDMPRLLVVYRTTHVLEDYREMIAQRLAQGSPMRCWYAALSLSDALGGQLQNMELLHKGAS